MSGVRMCHTFHQHHGEKGQQTARSASAITIIAKIRERLWDVCH